MAGDQFKFEPGQFKTEAISGDEAAKHRAMFVWLEDNGSILQDATVVIKAAKLAPKIIAVAASIFALSAALSAFARLYGAAP